MVMLYKSLRRYTNDARIRISINARVFTRAISIITTWHTQSIVGIQYGVCWRFPLTSCNFFSVLLCFRLRYLGIHGRRKHKRKHTKQPKYFLFWCLCLRRAGLHVPIFLSSAEVLYGAFVMEIRWARWVQAQKICVCTHFDQRILYEPLRRREYLSWMCLFSCLYLCLRRVGRVNPPYKIDLDLMVLLMITKKTKNAYSGSVSSNVINI